MKHQALFALTVCALAIPSRALAGTAPYSPVAASYDAVGSGTNAGLTADGEMQYNQPPTAVTDTRHVQRCTITAINVLANDSDPENNLPLSLVSVSAGTIGTAYIWGSSTVYYESTITPGSESLTYVVQDSLGATSNGSLNITISGGILNCV
jgi:hypothetical protein